MLTKRNVVLRVQILMVLAFMACESPRAPTGSRQFEHFELDVDALAGDVLSASPSIGQPFRMHWTAGRLWILDAKGDPWLHMLDPEAGDVVYSGGLTGEGPGDYDMLFGIGAVPGQRGVLWAFDPALGRGTMVGPLGPDGKPSIATIQLNGPSVSHAVWVDADRLIGVGPTAAERFTILTASGELAAVVEGPLLGAEDVPMRQRITASYGLISVCAIAGGFAIAYGGAGRVEMYDSDGRFVRTAEVPYPSDAVFARNAGSGELRYEHPCTWYVDCYSTNTHVFALFSGRLQSEFQGMDADSGEFVHIFRNDGALERVLRLDHAVRAIAVDENGRTLFGASTVDARILQYAIE